MNSFIFLLILAVIPFTCQDLISNLPEKIEIVGNIYIGNGNYNKQKLSICKLQHLRRGARKKRTNPEAAYYLTEKDARGELWFIIDEGKFGDAKTVSSSLKTMKTKIIDDLTETYKTKFKERKLSDESYLQQLKKQRNLVNTLEDLKKVAGIGGTYEFVRETSSINNLVTADHGPPSSVYQWAKDAEIRNILYANRAAVSMRDTLHENLITTSGGAKENLMKENPKDLEKFWKNPDNNKIERSDYFNSHMAQLFQNGEYENAIQLQLRGWEFSLKENMLNQIKSSNQLANLKLTEIVSKENLKILEEKLPQLKGEQSLGILLKGKEITFPYDGKSFYIDPNMKLEDLLKNVKIDPVQLGEKLISDIIAEGFKFDFDSITDFIDNRDALLKTFLDASNGQLLSNKPSDLRSVFKGELFDAEGSFRKEIFDNVATPVRNLLTEDALKKLSNSNDALSLPLSSFLDAKKIKKNKHNTRLLSASLSQAAKDKFDRNELVEISNSQIKRDPKDAKLGDVKLETAYEVIDKQLKSLGLQSSLLDLNSLVEKEYASMKPGIKSAFERNVQNLLYGKTIDQVDNFKNQMMEEFNLKNLEPLNDDTDIYRKTAAALSEEVKKVIASCSSKSTRRSAGAGSTCCICALRKKRSKRKKTEIEDSELETEKKRQSTTDDFEKAVDLKQLLKNGDVVDALAGVIKDSSKLDVNFDKVLVGKSSMKKAIAQKFKKYGSVVKTNIINGGKIVGKSISKLGAKSYAKIKNVHKKLGPFNKAFLWRNLATGLRNGDIKSIGTTAALVGASKLANFLTETGKTKGIWKFKQGFVTGLGKTLNFGVDAFGIYNDIQSIIQNVECLKQGNKNVEICENEKKHLAEGTNLTALIIILENSQCSYEVDICSGRDATVEIVASSISIGLSSVGIVCTPCQPVTAVLDFTINRVVEIFQIGKEIHSFNKVIHLTNEEIVKQTFRKLLFLDFSSYLKDLKEIKKTQTEVAQSMSKFLLTNNQTFSAIVVPKKSNFKCESKTWFWDLDINFDELDSVGSKYAGKNNQGYRCDTFDAGPPEDTIIDLDYANKSTDGRQYLARWSPDLEKLPKQMVLFCPPLLEMEKPGAKELTVKEIPSYCLEAFGLENIKAGEKRKATLLHYNFHDRKSPGLDRGRGYAQSPNVFIFNNTEVEFYGGEKNDLFVIQGCCPTGLLVGGGGQDTLDLTNANSTYRIGGHGAVQITFEGSLVFNPLQSLDFRQIEILLGAAQLVEQLVANCQYQEVNLGGGSSLNNMDTITIPQNRGYHCESYNLTLNLADYTLVESMGVGTFNWRIGGKNGIKLQIGSPNSSSHNIYLSPYQEIKRLQINASHVEIEMTGADHGEGFINIELTSSNQSFSDSTENVLIFTETKFMSGFLFPSSRILFTPLFELGVLIDVNINDNYGQSDYSGETLKVRGSSNLQNMFVIHSAQGRNRWRDIFVVGNADKNIFIVKGPVPGVLECSEQLNSSSTLDLSGVPFNTLLYLNFVSAVILFDYQASLKVKGSFTDVLGRHGVQDICMCVYCAQQRVDLQGGLHVFAPDVITINSAIENENQTSCSENLTLQLWSYTDVINNGKRDDEFFIYSIHEGSTSVIVNVTQDTKAIHIFPLQFTYLYITEMVSKQNTVFITLKSGNLTVSGPSQQFFERESTVISTLQLIGNEMNLMNERYRRASPDSLFVPSARIILREGDPTLYFDLNFASETNLPKLFRGHNRISNLFVIYPSKENLTIVGGEGNDTYLPLSFVTGDFISKEGFNTLDLSHIGDTNNTEETMDMDLKAEKIIYNDNRNTTSQLTIKGFQYLIGSPDTRDTVIADSCTTKYVDLKGGGSSEMILIPSDENCTNNAEITIVVRNGIHVFIDSIGGNFEYEASVETFLEHLDFNVHCFHQDMMFGLCYGTTQKVKFDVNPDDFRDIQVFFDKSTNKKTIQFTTKEYVKLNFTLKFFNKIQFQNLSPAAPQQWNLYIPSEANLEEDARLSPNALEDDGDLDELLVSQLEYIQDTFSFEFSDGSQLNINRLNKLTFSQSESDCRTIPIEEILEPKKKLAFKFQATIVVNCDDGKLVIIGGDEIMDLLENVPSQETHLLGNMGVETVFKIVPSKFTTTIHLPGFIDDTKYTLDLSFFYNSSRIVTEVEFPQVTQVNENDLLLEIPSSTQKIVFSNGAFYHDLLNVVLRYSELSFTSFNISVNSTDEHRKQKRDSSILELKKWKLTQKHWTIPEEKAIVLFSAEDLDSDSPGFKIPFSNAESNSVFRLEDDAIIVTNMFHQEKGSSGGKTFIILDSHQDRFGDPEKASQINLFFQDTKVPLIIDKESLKSFSSIETTLLISFYLPIVVVCVVVLFSSLLVIVLIICFVKHRVKSRRMYDINKRQKIAVRKYDADFEFHEAVQLATFDRAINCAEGQMA